MPLTAKLILPTLNCFCKIFVPKEYETTQKHIGGKKKDSETSLCLMKRIYLG